MKLKKDRQRTYNVTLRRVRATTLQLKSSKYYPFRQCVFAVLGNQNVMRMRRVCHVARPALLYFFTLRRKSHHFRGGLRT